MEVEVYIPNFTNLCEKGSTYETLISSILWPVSKCCMYQEFYISYYYAFIKNTMVSGNYTDSLKSIREHSIIMFTLRGEGGFHQNVNLCEQGGGTAKSVQTFTPNFFNFVPSPWVIYNNDEIFR